jgi:hypothetical protein
MAITMASAVASDIAQARAPGTFATGSAATCFGRCAVDCRDARLAMEQLHWFL